MSPHAKQQCRHSGKLVWSSDCSQNALTRFNDKKPNTKQTHAQRRPFTVRQAYAMLNTAGLDNYSYAREKKTKTHIPSMSLEAVLFCWLLPPVKLSRSWARSNTKTQSDADRGRWPFSMSARTSEPAAPPDYFSSRRRSAPLQRPQQHQRNPTHTHTHTHPHARTHTHIHAHTRRPVDWTDTRYLQLIWPRFTTS